eukprot:Sdes_comp19158_c0_seq1m9924
MAPQDGLSSCDKMLLQVVMSRSLTLQSSLYEFYTRIYLENSPTEEERSLPEDGFSRKIAHLNESLRKYFFEIKKFVSEDNGKIYWGFCSSTVDISSKISHLYSQSEISLFKELVRCCVESPTGEVSSNAFLNEPKLKQLSKTDASFMIAKFSQNRWISKRDGLYSLGPRAVFELLPWIRDQYGDILTECSLCMEICIKGQTCSNPDCSNKMHFHCSAAFFQVREVKQCNKCHHEWPSAYLNASLDAFETGPEPSMPVYLPSPL